MGLYWVEALDICSKCYLKQRGPTKGLLAKTEPSKRT
jgi:hypothetical protein